MQRDGWRAQAPGVLSPLREGPGLLPLVIKGRLRQRGACGLQNKGDCTWGLSEALSWGLPEIQEKAPPPFGPSLSELLPCSPRRLCLLPSGSSTARKVEPGPCCVPPWWAGCGR